MICPNCKAEITNDMNFCIKCGTKIETPETESKPEETPIQIPKVVPVQSPAPAKPAEAPQPAAPAQASPVQPAESSGPAESSAADKTAPETSEKHIVCPKCGAQLKEGVPLQSRKAPLRNIRDSHPSVQRRPPHRRLPQRFRLPIRVKRIRSPRDSSL